SSSAVQVTGITVTAAANPIVPRDQVTSKSIVDQKTVNNLPIDDVRNVITLQAGVVESGSGAGVSIRGGRPGGAHVYGEGGPGGLRFFASSVVQGQVSGLRGFGQDQVPTYTMGGLDTTVTINVTGGQQAVAIPRFVQYGGQCDAAQNAGFACQGRRLPMNWA